MKFNLYLYFFRKAIFRNDREGVFAVKRCNQQTSVMVLGRSTALLAAIFICLI